ncbi:MAG: hypothetical protein GY856_36765 [bacterium]|nr:hypothetical protein [bacterium]
MNLLQRKLALQALRGVVTRTPVDTGRARGNWQTTTARPADDQVAGVGADPIAEGTPTITAAPPFGVIWLSNNVPYIEVLEDGSSAQAPNGMLNLTLGELRTQFS